MAKRITTYFLNNNFDSGLEFRIQYLPYFFEENGQEPMVPHAHDLYQIIWFRKARGVHHVDFREYPVSDNSIYFISPGQIHSFDGLTDTEGIIIQFNADLMTDEQSRESLFIKYNMFNAFDSLPYCVASHNDVEDIGRVVAEMEREYAKTELFAHREYMQNLIRLFLIRVQRISINNSSGMLHITNNAHYVFVKFRQLLEMNYSSIHTVKEYANMLNVSPRTLTEYVRQSSHRTPLQIINDRIILEAKRLLRHSPLKIKEISYRLGFEDPSYFVKVFKRETGYMPTDFREAT